MNVGLSTSVIQRGRSGVAQYVFALVRALLAHVPRHRFTLFVLAEDRPLFQFAASRMEIVGVDERQRRPLADIAWHQRVLPELARRHGLDVLHVPSYRRMLWSAPCARVATIHDLAPFHLAGKYDWARMFYGRVVARRLARRQDRIIAVSRTTAEDIVRRFGVAPDRVHTVLNGLDHARFRPGSVDRARAWAARQGVTAPFFLYLARLEHPGKNHVRLIEAFEQFKRTTGSPWQLVFGGADWHGAPAIHARVDRSPWAGDIRRLGFVPAADVPHWYRAAGALAYPSLFEGFGFPPLEAMACGCPVMCSPRGALAETTGGAAALVDPEDIAGMAWEMTRLATDPAWRATLRAAGAQRAAHFDWARAAEETLAAYAAAASPREAARCDREADFAPARGFHPADGRRCA
ncbi:MAG TPA: glycosyltransferase family 1 protein [Lacunisphaera sp.]|jgi:glycosyltransferase involved in cell wall biosynthesis|nr:glycosyltransferase family 1 protein [Lacunisphaera sp.]